jgi:predicted transcriptional regulator YdeE
MAAAMQEVRMDPKIVERPQLMLAGVVGGAPDVSELDIAAIWDRFIKVSEGIAHTVEGAGYELHIETPTEPRVHYCLAGTEVSAIGALPPDVFVKVLPPCTYAVFTHRVVDGYGKLNERISAWLASSGYEEAHPFDFQLYDSRFTSMDAPESVQDIYVPVRRSR